MWILRLGCICKYRMLNTDFTYRPVPVVNNRIRTGHYLEANKTQLLPDIHRARPHRVNGSVTGPRPSRSQPIFSLIADSTRCRRRRPPNQHRHDTPSKCPSLRTSAKDRRDQTSIVLILLRYRHYPVTANTEGQLRALPHVVPASTPLSRWPILTEISTPLSLEESV